MITNINHEEIQNIDLKGILIPNEWGKEGVVTDLVMCAAGEKEFFIEHNTQGQELIEYINHMEHAKVAVQGTLYKDSYGEAVVSIENYQILPW